MQRKSIYLNTQRLVLRPLRPDDARAIATLAGDWDVARMTDRIPYPYTHSQAMSWIDDLPETEQVFAIDLAGQLIGLCGLMQRSGQEAEIGYWIGKPWWEHGYAFEAAQALVRHAFKTLKFSELTCCHYIDNPRSQRVIEKLGFEKSCNCTSWCDARRRDVQAIRYTLKKPRRSLLTWTGLRKSAA